MAATSQDPQIAKSSPFNPSSNASSKAVKDDVDTLRSDIASLAASVSQLATDKVGTATEDAKSMAKDKLNDVESAIRKNPTQAALIAVGVGFAIGLLLSR